MKKYIQLIIILFLPGFIKRYALILLGNKVDKGAQIGFSIIFANFISLGKNSKIGNFNFIKVTSLILKDSSRIKSFNIFKGPMEIFLDKDSIINKKNKITRGYFPITDKEATFRLGINSIITINHLLDVTQSICIGNNSILAGISSQLWTHSYYHYPEGPDRVRIDGTINIGDNVYVGSTCVFTCGVTVGNSIHIGANSVISKDLMKSGIYVNQKLRYLDFNIEHSLKKLNPIDKKENSEQVYLKTSSKK